MCTVSKYNTICFWSYRSCIHIDGIFMREIKNIKNNNKLTMLYVGYALYASNNNSNYRSFRFKLTVLELYNELCQL